MPAVKTNYVVIFKGESQVYGTANEKIALETPPPEGVSLEDKRVMFITYHPDREELIVQPFPQDRVLSAGLKYPKSRQKKEEDEQT
jgi:hypothetical protein